jgi:hypothetical protein
LQPEFVNIYGVVVKTSFLKIFIGNINAQTSEVDLTTGVKGREVKISLHQKKKRVAFGLEKKQFS